MLVLEEKAGPLGRAKPRCKHTPQLGETHSLDGRVLKTKLGCLWS